MFNRKTSTPAWTSSASFAKLRQAGPTVATIFVRVCKGPVTAAEEDVVPVIGDSVAFDIASEHPVNEVVNLAVWFVCRGRSTENYSAMLLPRHSPLNIKIHAF